MKTQIDGGILPNCELYTSSDFLGESLLFHADLVLAHRKRKKLIPPGGIRGRITLNFSMHISHDDRGRRDCGATWIGDSAGQAGGYLRHRHRPEGQDSNNKSQ